MASLNKSKVPVAQEHKTKLDLSFNHVTSTSFMRVIPVGYRHMIAGERIKIHPNIAVRPAPIEVPFFGSLVHNLRVFFVPYRLAFPQYDSFIGDTIGVNSVNSSLVSSPPVITNSNLVALFTDPQYSLSSVVSTGYDFEYGGNFYKLDNVGRRFIQVLEMLGYKVIWSSDKLFTYNALALLSLSRIYVDWYANHNYLNTADILAIKQLLSYNDPVTPLSLSAQDVYRILSTVQSAFYLSDDYATAAWDNPVSPISGQFTPLSFTDPSSTGGAFVQTNTNGTPEMVSSVNYPNSIGTTYIHEALKRLTDYQKRHALVGALEIDRLLAEHGFVSPYQRLMRSVYIGSQTITIDTGSVMATAAGSSNSSESNVGDYAGAGFGATNDRNSKEFEFSCSEDGILIMCSSIVPVGDLVQGYDRNNRLLSKEQFFNADFDALGMSAIEKGEIYVADNDNFASSASDYAGVFGFTGQYGEKKRPKSFLTGDMRWPNYFVGGSSWHLFRLFQDSSFSSDISNVVHSLNFTKGEDAFQYHRIFQMAATDYDPFYCFYHFDVASFAPCKPLFDTYEFDSNGKDISFDNTSDAN